MFTLCCFGVCECATATVGQGCRVVTDLWVARWCNGAFGLRDGASTLVYLGVVLLFTLLVFARTIVFTLAMYVPPHHPRLVDAGATYAVAWCDPVCLC